MLTNDELLYDPDEDDRDQAWVDAKRKSWVLLAKNCYDKCLWCSKLIWIFDTDTDIRDGCPRQQTEKTKPRLFQAVMPCSTVPPVWPPCAWTVRGTATFISYCTVSIGEDYLILFHYYHRRINKRLFNLQAWEISDTVQSNVCDELHCEQRGSAAIQNHQ